MFVEIFRPQWHMTVWLGIDYCAVDNESQPILIICPKHSKTIDIVSLSDLLKNFHFWAYADSIWLRFYTREPMIQ